MFFKMRSFAASNHDKGSRARILGFSLAVFLLSGFIISVFIGSVSFQFGDILRVIQLKLSGGEIPSNLASLEKILFSLRIPRTLLMTFIGAALACSGASYQGLFRNPLADPFLIGVSSGASLGAVISMSVHWTYFRIGLWMTPILSFLFALITVFIVFYLGRIGGSLNTSGLILSGVAVNAFASAITYSWILISSNEVRHSLSWMLGGIYQSGWESLMIVIPIMVIGMAGQWSLAYPLNILQFGDEQASQLGVNVHQIRRRIIFFSTLTTAAAISFSGIIGFVGLIVPHTIRLVCGSDYRRLIPLSILGGAFSLLAADVISRWIIAPQELPVGIITAITGAPFFLWLLQRSKHKDVL